MKDLGLENVYPGVKDSKAICNEKEIALLSPDI